MGNTTSHLRRVMPAERVLGSEGKADGRGNLALLRRLSRRQPARAPRALDIIVPILPGQLEPLETLLTEIGKNVRNNPYIDFSRLTALHFLRWLIVRDQPKERVQRRPLLVFDSNFDGDPEDFLDQLIAQAGRGLRAIYRHCGYPAAGEQDTDAALKQFLRKARQRRHAAFFQAYPYLEARDIRNNEAVWELVDQLLDAYDKDAATRPRSPEELEEAFQNLHAKIQQSLATCSALLMGDESPPATFLQSVLQGLARSRTAQVGTGLCLLPVLLPTAVLALCVSLALWRKEQRDEEERKTEDLVNPHLIAQEDFQVQNQLTHVVDIKPGVLRQLVLHAVLASINLLAKHYYTHGRLGSIQTIHFASWRFIEGRRLLFFSNYDGNWESYLDDFVNRASLGLTSIWSNTRGFPKTGWLFLKGGSRRAKSFKQWTRNHQIPTQVWYSAHSEKSLQNILEEQDFCSHVRKLSPADLRSWLPRF